MRTLLILCATLTIIQVLDVPIAGLSTEVQEEGKTDPNKAESTRQIFKKTRVEFLKYGKGVLSGILKRVTKFGKSTLKFGGSIVNAPLSIGSNVIDVADQFVRIPTKVSNAVSQKAIHVLANGKYEDSNEQQIGNKEERHVKGEQTGVEQRHEIEEHHEEDHHEEEHHEEKEEQSNEK